MGTAPTPRRRRRTAITVVTGTVFATTVAAGVGVSAAEAGTTAVASAAVSPPWSGWITEPDEVGARLAGIIETDEVETAVVSADADGTLQTWRGVGAALTDASVTLLTDRPTTHDLLFDPLAADGARLNLLRLPLSATDFSTDWWTWGFNARRNRATPPAQAIEAADLTIGLTAIRPDLAVVATAWTAPADMKNGRRLDGGSLRSRSESDYADLLVAQTEWLQGRGVPLSALTVVNEPGHSGNYPTMTMTDRQLATVGTDVAQRVAGNGVEVWAVDHNWSDRDRVDAVLAQAPGTFSAAAFHCYGGTPDQMRGLAVPAIITECTGTDDSWAGTFAWDIRHLVVDAAAAGSTGLMMWNLALDPEHGPKAPGGCENCRGLLTVDPATGSVEPGPEFYTLAHVARAADPGAVVLATAAPAQLPAVAFVNPDGTIGVVGHNDTGIDQVVAFDIDGQTHRFRIPAAAMFTVRGGTEPVEPLPVVLGDIALDPTGGRWFISAGATTVSRQWIADDQTFVCDLARGGALVPVDETVLDRIPAAADRTGGDCIVRAPEGDAHVVNSAGLRQWIPDGATWFCEIDRGVEVIDSTRAYVDGIPEGAWRECS